MRNIIKKIVEDTYKELVKDGVLPDGEIGSGHLISVPKMEKHGDYASNFGLVMAASLKMPPRKLAEILKNALSDNPDFRTIEVAGPGFLNFFFSNEFWQKRLLKIKKEGEAFGQGSEGAGKKVLVEFVSANPTGPLHVGHGRGAAVGDSLCRILKAAGFQVDSEYYINDVGNQMNTLGRSVYLRYQEYFGKEVEFPDECYKGEYIKEIAKEIAERHGDRFLHKDMEECLDFFTREAVDRIFAGIREDLDIFRVHFDNWFSEKTLHDSGYVEETISMLMDKGVIYEKDGALWFKTSEFGDEKDRVVKRSNGVLTYFAADIAYHRNKLERGYDMLVDIWGADHHGYVPRVKAAIAALGHDPERLSVLLVQLVNLIEGGKLKAMSTRAGEFVTLRQVLDDVGVDATRFIFLTRKCDSHLDFDLDIARKQSQENPVYYVQYAHARLCSVFATARERGVEILPHSKIDLTLLKDPEEIRLMKFLVRFPEVVTASAVNLEPHRVSYFLTELAGMLHKYYTKHRFIGDDPELTQARLLLADVTRTVLKNGLTLLGVDAPEKM